VSKPLGIATSQLLHPAVSAIRRLWPKNLTPQTSGRQPMAVAQRDMLGSRLGTSVHQVRRDPSSFETNRTLATVPGKGPLPARLVLVSAYPQTQDRPSREVIIPPETLACHRRVLPDSCRLPLNRRKMAVDGRQAALGLSLRVAFQRNKTKICPYGQCCRNMLKICSRDAVHMAQCRPGTCSTKSRGSRTGWPRTEGWLPLWTCSNRYSGRSSGRRP